MLISVPEEIVIGDQHTAINYVEDSPLDSFSERDHRVRLLVRPRLAAPIATPAGQALAVFDRALLLEPGPSVLIVAAGDHGKAPARPLIIEVEPGPDDVGTLRWRVSTLFFDPAISDLRCPSRDVNDRPAMSSRKDSFV